MRLFGASAEEAEVLEWTPMYYFYVLRFKNNGKFYYGFTGDLKKRIAEHRLKKSDFTSRNGAFDLVFYEAYLHKKDGLEAEKYFKTGHGREVLKGKLKNYLLSLPSNTGGFA